MQPVSFFVEKIVVRIFLQRLSDFYSPLRFFKVRF